MNDRDHPGNPESEAGRVPWPRRFRRRTAPPGPATLAEQSGTDRRSFLRSSGGYAATAALVGVPAAVVLESDAAAATQAPKVTANPTSPPPVAPTMAYVHNVKAGTVVIVTGDTQRTVRDHDLVHKLLNAPVKKKAKRKMPSTKRKAG